MKSCVLSLTLCLSLLVGRAQIAAAPGIKEFEVFWKKLQTAIVKKDFTAISQHTEFPLVVKKSLSDTSVQSVTRENFADFFSHYLELPAEDHSGNKYDQLRAKRALTDDDADMVSDDAATIGDFEFLKVEGRWKLVYVYATDGE
ncbi:hypothetical protein ACWKWU_09035 [Chitinophaga lutea]